MMSCYQNDGKTERQAARELLLSEVNRCNNPETKLSQATQVGVARWCWRGQLAVGRGLSSRDWNNGVALMPRNIRGQRLTFICCAHSLTPLTQPVGSCTAPKSSSALLHFSAWVVLFQSGLCSSMGCPPTDVAHCSSPNCFTVALESAYQQELTLAQINKGNTLLRRGGKTSWPWDHCSELELEE